ncbi:MAG: L,D-transpeptidase family protein, partial [Gemmatimonadota bacterium]
TLADAVRRFQLRHGLDADGVVGAATVAALNVPAQERLRALELNMERWRWLPEDLGERHVEVNIAAFQLQVVERGHVVQSHRVVVGRQYRQTPMFTGAMTYLVFSPYWHVPPSIAAIDKLPVVREDPGYLRAQHMVVLDRATNEEVDPARVDWASITGRELNLRYRLRQDPGPWNALGGVKFMFPNRHNVYLHDTPSRELFNRTARSFSSGCIRVEDPLALAEYVLGDPVRWSRDAIREAAARTGEQTVRLDRPIPVHLLYWTAWAAQDGTVHFRDDLYGRDPAVGGGSLAGIGRYRGRLPLASLLFTPPSRGPQPPARGNVPCPLAGHGAARPAGADGVYPSRRRPRRLPRGEPARTPSPARAGELGVDGARVPRGLCCAGLHGAG